MPFGNQKIDPKEVVKEAFGMDADEIKAQLAELKSIKETVDGVKTLASAQTGTLTAIQESIAKISTPYSGGGNNNAGGNNGGTGNNDGQRKEPRRWDEDADGAFTDRTAPIIAGVLDTRAMIAKREAIDEINGDPRYKDVPFHTLAKEIEEYTKTATLEQKAQPRYWTNVYKVCLSEKRDEIERDKAAKSGRFYVESASSAIIVNNEDKKKPEDRLTNEQLIAAKKSGLSPADYAKELESMQVWR